jgi:hypothetical protein
MAVVISIGKWGGIYTHFAWSWRVCIGWVAITIFPVDGDKIIDAASKWVDLCQKAAQQAHAGDATDKVFIEVDRASFGAA